MASFPDFKAVLFDKDGTLLDSLHHWAGIVDQVSGDASRHFFADRTGDQQKLMRDLMSRTAGIEHGRPLPGALVAGAHEDVLFGRFHTALFEADPLFATRVAPYDFIAWCKQQVDVIIDGKPPIPTPFPGAVELLVRLRERGLCVGIATSAPHEPSTRQLETLGMLTLVDWLGCCDSMPRPKPHGDGLRVFASAMGIRPGEVLMVGDTVFDEQFARNGGAGAFWGLAGTGPVDHHFQAPDRVFATLEELGRELA